MRHSHESSISAMSLTLVGVIACSLFVLARAPELSAQLQSVQLIPQQSISQPPAARQPVMPGTSVPGSSSGSSSPGSSKAPQIVDLMPSSAAPPDDARLADARLAEIDMRFQQATVMLHAQRFEEASVALHRVLQLSPRLAEAHANMGYALLGLEDYQGAHGFFMSATDLEPYLGNAYWGLAVTLEKLGDLEGALGAMRIYIHLAPPDDPYVRRARSALWEWDTLLGRGPVPEHEADWIERSNREWVERNLPDRDGVEAGEIVIPVREIN